MEEFQQVAQSNTHTKICAVFYSPEQVNLMEDALRPRFVEKIMVLVSNRVTLTNFVESIRHKITLVQDSYDLRAKIDVWNLTEWYTSVLLYYKRGDLIRARECLNKMRRL